MKQNVPFIINVLCHGEFIHGNTPTNFIVLQYPNGLSGVKLLTPEEQVELVAVVAAAITWKQGSLGKPPLYIHNVTPDDSKELVVCVGGTFGSASFVSVKWYHGCQTCFQQYK